MELIFLVCQNTYLQLTLSEPLKESKNFEQPFDMIRIFYYLLEFVIKQLVRKNYVNIYVFITLLCAQYSIIAYINYSAGSFKYTRIY
jgi:hypothetical protein